LISSCEENQTPSYQFEQVKYQDQKVPLDQKVVTTDASTDAIFSEESGFDVAGT